MDISDWRNKINEIDQQIVELLNQRARCSMEILKIKNNRGYSIHDPKREQEILRAITRNNGGPLGNQAILRIYQTVIEECRNLQQGKNV
ncbi:chorismate mutase [candidate division KSB1 bacterium]|nr:chorismate mutase [bacterium]OQX56979.1 MAG: hypothetical protein B5M50_06540 [candidate division KSB1 bacterium 4484_219]RKY76663.1 MAG: chorismate mutase [candidate division KSB1 bacterium]RKY78619.1 MAG: chorismate mutase [candidate division KSB1 bacterium]RKY83870.1 MAG: chorismate mutase [candidate division KSB1 bacterium]